MSSTLNRTSVLQCFESSNVAKIRNGMFDFYLGLPHTCVCMCSTMCEYGSKHHGRTHVDVCTMLMVPPGEERYETQVTKTTADHLLSGELNY